MNTTTDAMIFDKGLHHQPDWRLILAGQLAQHTPLQINTIIKTLDGIAMATSILTIIFYYLNNSSTQILRFFRNSEVFASEFLEHIEEMFPVYCQKSISVL